MARAVVPGARPYFMMTASAEELAAALLGPPGPSAGWPSRTETGCAGCAASRLPQATLASLAGVSLTAVARLERQARASCRRRTLSRVAAALGTDPADITPAPPERTDDAPDG